MRRARGNRFIPRLLLGIAPVAAVAGVLALSEEVGPRGEKGFPPGSVYDEGPKGLSMAHRWVAEQAASEAGEGRALVLTRRTGPGVLPSNGVLFRIQPTRGPVLPPEEGGGETEEPTDDEEPRDARKQRNEKRGAEERGAEERERLRRARLLTTDEESWVRGGGRLVLGLDSAYGPVDVVARGSGEIRKVFPTWPGVVRLDAPGKGRGLDGAPVREGRTIFARGGAAILTLLPLGKGEVVLLVVPEVLANASLASADHGALLATLVGRGRPVLFDERAHGLGRDDDLLSLLFEFGLGPSLLVAGLGFLLALWRGRVRLGEPEKDEVDRRSEAVDLVLSLGELYHRALSRNEALRLHVEGLRRAVMLRTGLRGQALEKRVRGLVGTGLPGLDGPEEMPPAVFERALQAVNEGFRRLEQHVVSR